MSLLEKVRRSTRPAALRFVADDGQAGLPPHLDDQVGHIDVINAGMVAGWAALRSAPDTSFKVRLFLDDTLCAEGLASLQRDDVAAAGCGNGRHGFELPIPKKALICADVLSLLIVDENGASLVCERKLLRRHEARSRPVLWMDASDLIEFLTHHRELSGIQRVQAGYLLGLGEATVAGTDCRICVRFKSSSFFFEVPHAAFAALMRQAGEAGVTAWSDHVHAFRMGLSRRAELAPGDMIFTLGAPWALDDHNETIRCAKLHDGARYMQIFYDLIPISVPEVVAAPLIPHFARAMAAMATYADHIFSISRYSQDELDSVLRRLGRRPPPISVVPMGGTIDDAERRAVALPDEAGRADATRADTLERLGVAGPYVLCVGTLEPRKNHALLFQVWRRLVAIHGPDAVPRLVLVGRVGWYMDDFMRQLKVTGFVDGTVVHLQGVSNADLSVLYDSCLFTAFPSFSEGWGLPITESLARGKVCVCSGVTSMPEAGGDHAIYIDPYDTTAAYEVCRKLIFEPAFRASEEERARAFTAPTWAQASDGLRAQFEDLLPRLAALPKKALRRSIDLGRSYKFFNIEAASPHATALQVFGNFLDQEDALDLLAGWNWFDLDVNCTWACGPVAELSLVLPSSAGGFAAYLHLVIPPAYDGVLCEIALDGQARGTFHGSGAKTIGLEIGPSVERERLVRFRFLGDRLRAADWRLLGIGIASIIVFAENDYKGRLEHFEQAVELLGRRA